MRKFILKMARAMGRVLSHLLHSNAWKKMLRVVTELLTINAIKH